MNTNKEVEWRRFIVPKKVEQINDHLFIDTYLLSINTQSHRVRVRLLKDFVFGFIPYYYFYCYLFIIDSES